jgi:hypothetical protein
VPGTPAAVQIEHACQAALVSQKTKTQKSPRLRGDAGISCRVLAQPAGVKSR